MQSAGNVTDTQEKPGDEEELLGVQAGGKGQPKTLFQGEGETNRVHHLPGPALRGLPDQTPEAKEPGVGVKM